MSQHRSIITTLLGRRVAVAMRNALMVTVGCVSAAGAPGQSFPDRPLHLLVGLPPGGGADVVARAFAEGLSRDLGQQVLVDNRAGSAGLIAADAAAKSAPDGYTLLFGTMSSNAIFASLYKKLPYDPVASFTPVSMIATYPLVLVVNTALPCRSMDEFIAYAKARPGKLSYASAGHGSPLHLAMEMLKVATGTDIVHVPYKGGVQALGDLLSGEIHVVFDTLPTQLAHIKAGRVRALAVTSAHRSTHLPDVPTLQESGVAGLEFSGWFALFAPAGVSPETQRRLHAGVVKVLADPATRQRLAELGVDPGASTPQALAVFQRTEIVKWGQAVKASGATVD